MSDRGASDIIGLRLQPRNGKEGKPFNHFFVIFDEDKYSGSTALIDILMDWSFKDERDGQRFFYETFLPRVDNTISMEDILEDYSDGIVNGNIIEFKLNINDINATLFQTIKYLSRRRIKGKPIPANILLISLNQATAYLYHSQDYLECIEKEYAGAASLNTSGFSGGRVRHTINFNEAEGAEKLIALLRSNCHTKIHLDENCIVGWAMSYYSMFPNASKSSFLGDSTGKTQIIGEIRKPDKLKDYIYPYKEKDNVRFQYLMDKLNDFFQKKNLGAFYTPLPYAEKAIELVRDAIKRVPEGNDYIILDRCAGTGNLEQQLSEEELSHTIVSTLEYYEYKVLMEVLGDKVRHVIPPIEQKDTFARGLVRGADALSRDFIEHPTIKQYIDNPKCTIILFENPPYSEPTSIEHQKRGKGKKSAGLWKESFVCQEMKKEVRGVASNELGNLFIWSAFKYYIRQDTDTYVVFSPVKYWKAQHLVNNVFQGGFAFNRRHFHTKTNACIMCASWGGEYSDNQLLTIRAFDLDKEGQLVDEGTLSVKRVYHTFSQKYYGKKDEFVQPHYEDGILCGPTGLEAAERLKKRIAPFFHKDMIGYLQADSYSLDKPDANSMLLIAGKYNGNGFYLHKDDYLEKLPMFAASRYISYNAKWTERARIMKSGDGHEEFYRDVSNKKLLPFLHKCLLFTCLEPQNHMRSFRGSDGRDYKNQLCLDVTHGDTIASNELKNMALNSNEKQLIEQWQRIMDEAKKAKEYNSSITYGLYQIKVELNTYYKDEETGENVYHYPQLNSNIRTLAEKVKEYYLSEIVPTLFEYQFLK